jgi:hypothetical protein
MKTPWQRLIDGEITNEKEQSGFEDAPEIKVCRHPSHEPPRHMVIPFDKIYRHVCPSCGYTIRIRSNSPILCT